MCVVQAIGAAPPTLNASLKPFASAAVTAIMGGSLHNTNNNQSQSQVQQNSSVSTGDGLPSVATTTATGGSGGTGGGGLPLPPAKVLYCIRSMNTKYRTKILAKSAALKYKEKRRLERLAGKGVAAAAAEADEDDEEGAAAKKKKRQQDEADEWLYEINSGADISVLPLINTAIVNYLVKAVTAYSRHSTLLAQSAFSGTFASGGGGAALTSEGSSFAEPQLLGTAANAAGAGGLTVTSASTLPPVSARRRPSSGANPATTTTTLANPISGGGLPAAMAMSPAAMLEDARQALRSAVEDIKRDALLAAAERDGGAAVPPSQSPPLAGDTANSGNFTSSSSGAGPISSAAMAALHELAAIDFYGALAAEHALRLANSGDEREGDLRGFKLPYGFLGSV